MPDLEGIGCDGRVADREYGGAVADRSDVVIVGGGIVGVCSAYFLAEQGARVTLLERGEICSGCSEGNAGWIFPSHSTPLPAPGAMRKALGWLFDPASPFYIKLRLNLDLVRWLWIFARSCTESRARRTFELNRELSLQSRTLYETLAALSGLEFDWTKEGLLLVCRTRAGLSEVEEELRLLKALGGEGRRLDGDETRELVPQLSAEIQGGIHYPADAHIQPASFVRGIAAQCKRRGVRILSGVEAIAFETSGSRISRVVATKGDFKCDHVVLAGGAWSAGLVAPLGLRIPVESAKGYSVTFERPDDFGNIPMLLAEAKVGASPCQGPLRFAGTLELAGLDLSINERRLRAILDAGRLFLPGLPELVRLETWRGLRPCTPDDLPIIGRPHAVTNLVLATGHGMSGISQGPITGKLVAELVSGDRPAVDLAPFSPDRFR